MIICVINYIDVFRTPIIRISILFNINIISKKMSDITMGQMSSLLPKPAIFDATVTACWYVNIFLDSFHV